MIKVWLTLLCHCRYNSTARTLTAQASACRATVLVVKKLMGVMCSSFKHENNTKCSWAESPT